MARTKLYIDTATITENGNPRPNVSMVSLTGPAQGRKVVTVQVPLPFKYEELGQTINAISNIVKNAVRAGAMIELDFVEV